MMRAYSIARHERRSHKRNSVIIPDNVKILSDVSEGGQETSTSADHLIESIASCEGTEDVNHDASMEVLEELQPEVLESSNRPSEPCHIDDVISEEPSEIVQEKSEEVQIQEDTHVEECCMQPNVEETGDNEVTHDTAGDTHECVEEPVCDASYQEITEVEEDATPSDTVLCMDEEPVAEVLNEEPDMHVDEIQTADELTGDAVVGENKSREEVAIESRVCMDERLDEDISKDETDETKLDASENDEQVIQNVECPETQEIEVADLSVLTTKKEGEKKSVSMASEDDSQRETPSPSFRKDRKRRMSIRRLSDAFVRSKFPGPVESPAQEVKYAIRNVI
ncbi:hypothetical protein K450DRAFT_242815 [Umbelopsis ramanniana AG]|uniref:Uncharacterized protein n=1 Tax=Umbelopsis ramanniana AG TaxID=1314678 RepID=A0AAD5E8H4_UMBRA|nr:uncharacterized protein K450DRAFT_242815 [Umbelopsis ramanniana AG]KAI8579343.1 hypothetical protein K450DRAFT_242815 [Umbelopsis ramanniana AG]